MAHDDTDKAAVMNDIWVLAKTLTSAANNNQSLRVTFTPVALTSAASQSGTWSIGTVQAVGTVPLDAANFNQDNLMTSYAFIHNTGRS